MSRNIFAGIALAVGILLGASGSQAAPDNAAKICIKEARCDARACNQGAMESHQAAKDLCLKRDHQCVEVCRADRAACVDDTGIEGALRGCAADLEDAREICRGSHASGSPGRDTCVDQAQVVAFQCRDAAKTGARPALKLCRSGFKSCASACGPVDPADPVDTKQCRIDAKLANDAAKAVCTEDFQFGKDACLHRNHECVESCRATRHGCTGPIFDTLEVAKDACRATRDLEFANCRNLYADEGTPERDACIDQAQVVAFVCRDDAREIAQPQLRACRQTFRGCVQICPAPAPAP